LNIGKNASKLSLEILLAESFLLFVSQANLNVKLIKKLGGQAGASQKSGVGKAPPGHPLESPLCQDIFYQ